MNPACNGRKHGDAGAPRPRPSPEGCIALWTSIRRDHCWLEARLAEGEPRLRGSRRTEGAPRRGACGAPPIRHGNCRDTFPSGEGGFAPFLGRARAGLPYGRPASHEGCAPRLSKEKRQPPAEPTEAAPAPPVMRRCGEPHRVRTVRLSPCHGKNPRLPQASGPLPAQPPAAAVHHMLLLSPSHAKQSPALSAGLCLCPNAKSAACSPTSECLQTQKSGLQATSLTLFTA